MPARAAKSSPAWVIDLHGMRDALRTKRNSVRSAIVAAIQAGTMHILKNVSAELKDLYPELYADFQAINGKKYISISVAASEAASMMMQECGTSPLGSIPTADRFEALATAMRAGAKLVSSGKAYTDCCSIAQKNNLAVDRVLQVNDFS